MNSNQKYKVVTKLIDDTEIIAYKDYNWGFEDDLNDDRKTFINVCGNMIRKQAIKSIVYEENEDYIEPEKAENND